MEKKVKELEAKLKNVTENWKRAAADYSNLEKRVLKEKETVVKFANAELIKKILPILDSLKEAAEQSKDAGYSLILKQLKDVLKDEGVVEIKTEGEKFDPQEHEAVEVVKGSEEGKIVEIIRTGYKIEDRVIRPAQVKVAKKEPPEVSERAEREGAHAGDYV